MPTKEAGPWVARREEDTVRLAEALADALAAEAPEGDVLLDLRGELGAGKTLFVRALGRALGVREAVVSPTFTIVRTYSTVSGLAFHHLDAYRLGGADELEAIGFEELCGAGCLTCVEWGERVEDALPMDRLGITLSRDTTASISQPPEDDVILDRWPRRIAVYATGPCSRRLLAAWQARLAPGDA